MAYPGDPTYIPELDGTDGSDGDDEKKWYCSAELSEEFRKAFPIYWKAEMTDGGGNCDIFAEELQRDVLNGACMLSYVHEIITGDFDDPFIELESPIHRAISGVVSAVEEQIVSALLTVIESGDIDTVESSRIGDMLSSETYDRIEKIMEKMK